MKYIAIDKIKGEFTEDSEPRDDYFIELLKKYIKEEIDPIPAILALKDIVPFSSEYKPETSPEF